MICDFVAELPQFRGDESGGFLFLCGELGIFMKMFVGGEERIQLLIDALIQVTLSGQRYRPPQHSQATQR